MRQETLDRYNAVKEKIKNGTPTVKACKEVGLGLGYFYALKNKVKTPKKKTANFVDVPMKTSSTKIAVVVCQPNQLMEILGGLQ